MADLIEIGVVFTDKGDGMKKAVTTAERLERQLKSLVKAANEGSVSQERFRQKLIVAGRELKKNSDMTGNQARGAIVKYTNALKEQMKAQDNSSFAIEKNTQALNKIRATYDRNFAAEQKTLQLKKLLRQEIANGNMTVREAGAELLKYRKNVLAFSQAQMAATKSSNRMGVVTQQAGYQVSDFIVQVQSGTNPFVAFSQQASQLAGVLPLVATQLGITTKAAIGLSAALGIAIPIVGLIGASLLTYFNFTKDAKSATEEFDESLSNLKSTLSGLDIKSLETDFGRFASEVRDVELSILDLRAALLQAEFSEAAKQLGQDFSSSFKDSVILGLQAIPFAEILVQTTSQKLAGMGFKPEIFGTGFVEGITTALTAGDIELAALQFENLLTAVKATETGFNGIDAEGKELLITLAKMINRGYELEKNTEEVLENLNNWGEPIFEATKDFTSLSGVQQKVLDDQISLFETSQQLTEEIGQAAKEALILAGVDITKPISDAQKEAAKLAADLGVSLEIALAMSRVRESQTVLDPRDPRYNEDEARLQRLKDMIESGELYNSTLDKTTNKTKTNTAATEDNRTAYEKAMMTAKEFADALDQQVLGAVDGVADAFSNFLQRGMKDFKSFVGSIKDMFIRLLADMAAMALKRQILIPIAAGFAGGFGSAAAGATTANLIAGGGMAGSLAAGASSFGAGLQASLGMGGFTSAGVFNVGANAAVATAAGGVGASATMATLGAAVPLIAAGVALFSLFGKKKKPAISAENMNKVNQALMMTGQELGATGREAQRAAAALGEVAGGFDKLTKKSQAFYENFYTEGERRTVAISEATQALNKTFADLEMAVPKTHSEFRQLVEAQDLMTEEGRKTYNSLLDISGAFVTLNGTMQQAVERAGALRREELALREARSLAKLEKFIGEDAAAATLERLSTQVYSGNIKSLVDGVFQEIFEALTPDGTQMRKITPYLEELTAQLEEVVKNLSATDDILRKYASGDIIGEIRKFTKQMKAEVRYLVDYSGGTPEGIAAGIFSSVKTAAQHITRIAKEMSRDLGIIFTEFSAEFKVENVLDESRKVTDRIDELLSAFTATRDSLLSSYKAASRAFDKAPSFDTTTEAGQVAFEGMIAAGRALSRARQEIDNLTTTIDTLSASSQAFEQAVADKLVEPIKEALTVYLPTALDDLPQDIKNTMGGLFAGITEGSLEGFQSAYVQLTELFTTNKITVDQFNDSFKIMEDVFRGNISLTDEYTTKQQSVIERLSRAYEDFTGKLENLLGVVRGGIDALLGQATSASVVSSRRGSQAYLRTVARTGQFDSGRLERAVGAVSAGDTTGFGTRQEFLRYVADTTTLLRTVEGTLSGQLDTLQMQQVKAILNIQDTNETAATSLQSIQNLLAEFLGVGGRIPTFATGGYHSGGLRIVGERGPELEATGPSRIIPAGQFSMGGDAELRREVAELRVDLKAALVQIAKNTRKSSDTLNKFDYQGLPNSRGY